MSSADRFLANSQRRKHRGVHLALAISVGVAAACAISLIAGARRSTSVVDRVFDSIPKYDLRIRSNAAFSDDLTGGLTAEEVESIPGVTRADPTNYIAFVLRDAADPGTASISSNPADFSLPNPAVRILRGHRPDGSDPFEVVVNQSLAESFSLDVGDQIPVISFGRDQYDDISRGLYDPNGPEYDFTIAAVVRFPSEVALGAVRSPRSGFTSADNIMIVSDDFFTAHHTEWIDFGSSFDIRLADGPAGVDEFLAELRSRLTSPDDLLSEPWTVADNKAAFEAPVNLETSALLAVGIGAALIAALIAVLFIRLERRLLEDDYPVLRAMGFTTRHLIRTAMLRVLPSALTAATIATTGAVALSDRFPIGVGRALEIQRGLQVDVAIVVGSAACVVLGLIVGAALSARRAGVRPTHTVAPRARSLVGTGRLPLRASIGARFATGGRDGARSSPIAASLATAVAAVVIVVAVSTWLAGTAQLYNSPSAHGWEWDLAVGNVNFTIDPATADFVTHSPLVSAATAISYGQATLNGLSTEVLAFDPAGTAPPATLSGRLPVTPSEVALGTGLLRELNVTIGDSVTFSLDGSEFVAPPAVGGQLTLTVVGESVSPALGESDIAEIGVVTLQAITDANGDPTPRLVMVDVVGPDVSANIDALIAPLSEEVHSDVIPARVVNLYRVRSLPSLGRLLVGVLGLIAVSATLLTPGRATRRKLAVLGALGLDRRGRRLVACWQGAFTALVVLVVGIPLGLVLGTAWWRDVADGLGVRDAIPSTAGAVTVIVGVAILGAIAASMLAIRRLSVARTLRGE